MPKFVLYPARLRGDKLVTDRDDGPVEMEWPELRDRFAPSRSRKALMILRLVKQGTFVGTRARDGHPATFILDAAGCSTTVEHVLRKDPAFEQDLQEVFLVDQADWESQFSETSPS